ncbi:UDP-glucose dehydrogenase family protein [Georgenia sp. Z1491]|uniref:UDP-glucose dehydrogenase family protein n=1 Tax=Georgenia sp. Z1491 TaxID=3416707 RepID=UPI003CF0B5C2
MRMSVVGTGYLGAVHAACMASLGHEVVGLDVDEAKVALLSSGQAPFHEPGFDELLKEQVDSGRLTFTTDPAEVAGALVHFIGVGTPQVEGGYAADLTYVDAAVASLLPHLGPVDGRRPLVVGKSTVPVGTAERLAAQVEPAGGLLVWNPEFLREGFAVQDTIDPDRIVYGLSKDESDAAEAKAVLDEVYAELLARDIPLVVTDYATAELVKVAANSFLATKISFINAMAELCTATGADVSTLAEAIGHDDRIGKKFLRAGIGFGGGCLPKDIRAFMARAGELGADQALTFLREVDLINDRTRLHAVDLARRAVGGRLRHKTVAVLGAAFKPDSDDMRNSPALDIARRVHDEGAHVKVTDPAAGPVLRKRGTRLEVVDSAREAADGADVVMLLTEWKQFKELDPDELAEVAPARIIVDGRNALDPARWRAAGWTYYGIGRP